MDKNDKLLDKKEKDTLEDINKKYRLDKEDGEEDIDESDISDDEDIEEDIDESDISDDEDIEEDIDESDISDGEDIEEDIDESDISDDEDIEDIDDSELLQLIEYESGNSGMIAIIVFVIVCVLIMGFMMLTSENNVTKKIPSKTSIVKEKGKEKSNEKGKEKDKEKKLKITAEEEVGKASKLSSKHFSCDKADKAGVLLYGDFESKLSDVTVVKSGDSKIVKDREIVGNNSGIVVTEKAKVICTNLEISTEGSGSPGIYIDDTDDNQSIVNGNIKTEGENSPAIYTSGKMSIESTNILSKCSEGMIIEGMSDVNISTSEVENKVTIFSAKKLKGTSIYMLGKGDNKDSKTSFSAKTSTINSYGGNIFDVENTMAIIRLEDCKFDSGKKSIFLEAQRNANVLLTAKNQEIKGFIKLDGSSKLDIQLSKGSTLKGAINTDDSECKAKLSLDKNSKLILTADCYLTEFSNELENNVNIESNGHKIYVNRKAIKLKKKKK